MQQIITAVGDERCSLSFTATPLPPPDPHTLPTITVLSPAPSFCLLIPHLHRPLSRPPTPSPPPQTGLSLPFCSCVHSKGSGLCVSEVVVVVGGGGVTLSDSHCTDVNDILLMLSATLDTGARRGHSAAQTRRAAAKLRTGAARRWSGTERAEHYREGETIWEQSKTVLWGGIYVASVF